jgi:hypothetical protein
MLDVAALVGYGKLDPGVIGPEAGLPHHGARSESRPVAERHLDSCDGDRARTQPDAMAAARSEWA